MSVSTRQLPVTGALIALSVSIALAFDRVVAGGRFVVPLVLAAALAHLVALGVRSLERGPVAEGVASGAVLIAFLLVLAPSAVMRQYSGRSAATVNTWTVSVWRSLSPTSRSGGTEVR